MSCCTPKSLYQFILYQLCIEMKFNCSLLAISGYYNLQNNFQFGKWKLCLCINFPFSISEINPFFSFRLCSSTSSIFLLTYLSFHVDVFVHLLFHFIINVHLSISRNDWEMKRISIVTNMRVLGVPSVWQCSDAEVLFGFSNFFFLTRMFILFWSWWFYHLSVAVSVPKKKFTKVRKDCQKNGQLFLRSVV